MEKKKVCWELEAFFTFFYLNCFSSCKLNQSVFYLVRLIEFFELIPRVIFKLKTLLCEIYSRMCQQFINYVHSVLVCSWVASARRPEKRSWKTFPKYFRIPDQLFMFAKCDFPEYIRTHRWRARLMHYVYGVCVCFFFLATAFKILLAEFIENSSTSSPPSLAFCSK